MTRDELLALFPGDSAQARLVREALEKIDGEHASEREQLARLFDEAPGFIWVLEVPGYRVTRINRKLRETSEGRDMLGKSVYEIYRADNPILKILDRVAATGRPETVRAGPGYLANSAHAHRFYTRRYTPLRDEHGTVNRILTVGFDVTDEVLADHAHAEAERQLQLELKRMFTLLDEAPVLMVVVEGPDLRVSMMNRRSRSLLGDRDVIGQSVRTLIPAGNKMLASIERVYATGVAESFESPSNVEGFQNRSFAHTMVPIRDNDGSVTRVMSVSVEITEQVQASEAKDRLLAIIGHELRNPLAPMLMTLGVMRSRSGASPEVELLERQVRHMTRLVGDLLDVSRFTRGMIELKREDIYLSSVVNRALEMASPLLEERGHEVVTDLVHRALFVSGDPDRLAQVVSNLITNAAKYSDKGSRIRIEGRRVGERARLSVIDHGIGIAPDRLDTVFEAFAQQPQTLARSHGGLGLGLTIVKSLVEAHGGVVSAHSAGPGLGSTFVVELPAIDTIAPVASRSFRPLAPAGVTRRVLVVDDDDDLVEAMQVGLRLMGHTVAVARDGRSALELAKTLDPQIGFLDIGLPGIDGYQLAGLLRAAHDIRLVAVSGYGERTDRHRAFDAGFDLYLVKPIDFDQLAEAIEQLGP